MTQEKRLRKHSNDEAIRKVNNAKLMVIKMMINMAINMVIKMMINTVIKRMIKRVIKGWLMRINQLAKTKGES